MLHACVCVMVVVLSPMVSGHLAGTSLSEVARRAIVNKHNEFRRQEGASNMLDMRWSSGLASMAQWSADRCIFDYSRPERALWEVNWTRVAQSIEFYSGTETYVDVMDKWYSAKQYYSYNTGCQQGRSCLEYTQMVWARTGYIGCGHKKCPKLVRIDGDARRTVGENVDLLVCNYGPAGNIAGEKPYLLGRACSNCTRGATCNRGLCSGAGEAVTGGGAGQVGGFTLWTGWSECSVTCGRGEKSRSRTCPTNNCVGLLNETAECNTGACAASWAKWQAWSICSATCGFGRERRTRMCNVVTCTGRRTQERPCTLGQCPPTGFSLWSAWSRCSASCGSGMKKRDRICFGGTCQGEYEQTNTCLAIRACPTVERGGYGEWGAWSGCTVTCGIGRVSRNRTCQGTQCSGGAEETESKVCNQGECARAAWSLWGNWGDCSATCEGVRERRRRCLTADPKVICLGVHRQQVTCGNQQCGPPPQPGVNGYGDWSSWSVCSVTCGVGRRSRRRTCRGTQCSGPNEVSERTVCNLGECATASWASWGTWGDCSATCGEGTRERTRICLTTDYRVTCTGIKKEQALCLARTGPCGTQATWNEWGAWSTCDKTCDSGSRRRVRTCSGTTRGLSCVGNAEETDRCNIQSCPGGVAATWNEWGAWSTCDKTCDGGSRRRQRTCSGTTQGLRCVGNAEETGGCNVQPCRAGVAATWNEWGAWSTCDKTCDGGSRRRERTCSGTTQGLRCVGNAVETERCNVQPCRAGSASWAAWLNWGECSSSCAGGTQVRRRVCNSGPFNNQNCVGEYEESRSCNTHTCPVESRWRDWSSWSACSVTCGTGTQQRTRSCVPGTGIFSDCSGDTSQTQNCTVTECDPGPGALPAAWTEWLSWGACSASCGGGERTRRRFCTPNSQTENDCEGPASDKGECSMEQCAPERAPAAWEDWANWGRCSVICGGGSRVRRRTCNTGTVTDCPGSGVQLEACSLSPCLVQPQWASWEAWGICSATCGRGEETRRRTCRQGTAGQTNCVGDSEERRQCQLEAECPVPAQWESWEAWGSCSATCGPGEETRRRTCRQGTAGQTNCVGDSEERRQCQLEAECPEPARWSDWAAWGDCSVTCGEGTQERSRTCIAGSDGRQNCQGDRGETRSCQMVDCPEPARWSDWAVWGDCSVTCGNGIQERSRTCIAGSDGRQNCQGDRDETRPCQLMDCPEPARWSDWAVWGDCSVTCGEGTQERSRTCIAGSDGRQNCQGDRGETRPCQLMDCPEPARWSDWAVWGTCSVTCGDGTQERSRTCIASSDGQQNCQGDRGETRPCQLSPACPVPARWSDWAVWGACSVTCGDGLQERSRTCLAGSDGRQNCQGDRVETRPCQLSQCPEPARWSDWAVWGDCSVTCGDGVQERSRTCIAGSDGRQNCQGDRGETRPCQLSQCPEPARWSDWAVWGDCSVTCGDGLQERSRTCIAGSDGRQNCQGDRDETRPCQLSQCPEPARWSDWALWGDCSVTCGDGLQERSRTCIAGSNGRQNCQGDRGETRPCQLSQCPEPARWSDWAVWGDCSVTCGDGIQERSRTCIAGSDCQGDRGETRPCQLPQCPAAVPNWDDWGSWGDCSVTCGIGEQKRNRACAGGNQQNCIGNQEEVKLCQLGRCPEWGAWQSMGTCSVTCGGGEQTYQRTCPVENACVGGRYTTRRCNTNTCPAAVWANWNIPACPVTCGGSRIRLTRSCLSGNCVGATFEDRDCNTNPCPVTATWGPWGGFTACPVTCGAGTMTRFRQCDGGTTCAGAATESQACNTQVCPGEWNSWLDWSTCSEACGDGTQTRERTCSTGSVGDCTGSNSETKACTGTVCPGVTWTSWSSWGECERICIQSRNRRCLTSSCEGRTLYRRPCGGDRCTQKAHMALELASCDFEQDVCPTVLTQEREDDFDWTRREGATPSGETGPPQGRNGGYYMYIEVSPPRVNGERARLRLSTNQRSGSKCLRFWYHMRGDHIGVLRVDGFAQEGGRPSVFFRKTGTQGAGWKLAEVQIGRDMTFVKFVGICGDGAQGDIAVDDVSLHDGDCGVQEPVLSPPAFPTRCQVSPTQTVDLDFTAGAPRRNGFCFADQEAASSSLNIHGYVVDTNCNPVSYAVIEVWQANSTGVYSTDCCGYTTTDEFGFYHLTTVMPASYNGLASNVHFRVTRGDTPFLTKMYFEGSSPQGGVPALTVSLQRLNRFLQVAVFNIVLQ